MKLKLLLGALAALLTLSAVGTAAFAADPQEGRTALGRVAAIEGTTLAVETRRQGTVDVLTDDDTVFRVPGVEEPTIVDVEVGDIVAGKVVRQENGTLLARVIAVAPPRADGGTP